MDQYPYFVQSVFEQLPKKHDPRLDPIQYMGTSHSFLGVANPDKHRIAADFKKQFPDISS